MAWKISDFTSLLSFGSGAFILSTSTPLFATAAKSVPVVGEWLAGQLTHAAEFFVAHSPEILITAGKSVAVAVTSIAGSSTLLGVAAVVGIAIAVPWAISMVGKLADGLVTQAELGVEKIRDKAVEGKYRLQFNRQVEAEQRANQLATVPIAQTYTPRAYPQNIEATRPVNHVENYQKSRQAIPTEMQL